MMFQNTFVKSFDFQSSFKNRPLRFSFSFDQVARKLGNASLWIDASLKSSSTHSVKAKSNIKMTYFTTKTPFWNFYEMISRKNFMPSLFLCFSKRKKKKKKIVVRYLHTEKRKVKLFWVSQRSLMWCF